PTFAHAQLGTRKGAVVATPPPGGFLLTPASAGARGAVPNDGEEGKGDAKVFKSNSALTEPTPVDELPPPGVSLPTGPIEPFLLTKANGPFMIHAYTFRGKDAVRYAQLLTMELRDRFRLPAYIFFLRIQPGRNNIRGIQPTAPEGVPAGDLAPPER